MLSSTNTVNTAQNKSFTYNLLNLPLVATFAAGTATYTYDATGNKLRKVDLKSGVTTTTDYISGIEYDNSTTTIGFIQTEEGKAVPITGGYDYTYYLGDNLGNTRITFDTKTGAAVTLQQDDYYPFGLEINHLTTSPKNEYLYNKKELQEETQEYDYGARFYDPLIGRFNTIDPLSEQSKQWTTYRYGFDNPIRFIDPDGMSEEDDELNDKTFEKNSDKSARIQRDINNSKKSTYSTYDNGEKTGEEEIKGVHFVRESQTPNIYRHTVEAQESGQKALLHYDDDKKRAIARRTVATAGYPTRTGEGLQRDEYPYASTTEGGRGASIAYVPAEENSKQGLLELAPLYKTLNPGDAFLVIPVSNENDRERQFVPVTSPQPSNQSKPKVSPVAVGTGVGAAIIWLLNIVTKVPVF
jgi:RHS repeat-associated protein